MIKGSSASETSSWMCGSFGVTAIFGHFFMLSAANRALKSKARL
jgi:hypothetical protein